MQKFENTFLNEKYFYSKHDSGLNIYLFPKPDYKDTFAVIGTNYGSINKKFKIGSDIIESPEGIAHFLEHKLFECKDGDANELFAKTGASPNACTSFNSTRYYFSCSDQLKDSLEILLNFVQEPYFTQDGITREQGIIGQEIKMYCDDPGWQANILLLGAMYKNHFVKDDIAGSVESISKITPDLLNKCYDAFYNLSNMTLCIAGNFDVDDIYDFIDKHIIKKNQTFNVETIIPDEPIDVVSKFVSKKMDVVNPVFSLGFKHPVSGRNLDYNELICSEIILKSLTLKSGNLYNELINKGFISTNNLDYELFHGPYYKSSIFVGESQNPEEAVKIIKEHIMKYVSNGIPEQDFERARKCVYADSVSIFDKVSSIASCILDLDFSNLNIFEFINRISKVTIDDTNKYLKQFSVDNSSFCKIF